MHYIKKGGLKMKLLNIMKNNKDKLFNLICTTEDGFDFEYSIIETDFEEYPTHHKREYYDFFDMWDNVEITENCILELDGVIWIFAMHDPYDFWTYETDKEFCEMAMKKYEQEETWHYIGETLKQIEE